MRARLPTECPGRRRNTITGLLAHREEIRRYADIRAFTSQAATRLEIVAADDDPRITDALVERDFYTAVRLLEVHYNLMCLDTGTEALESTPQGILQLAAAVADGFGGESSEETMLATFTIVSATPDPTGLPGSSVADKLINGLFFYTLIGCLARLFISVPVWVFASRVQNYHHAAAGRQATLNAAGGALVAGEGPAFINFFRTLAPKCTDPRRT